MEGFRPVLSAPLQHPPPPALPFVWAHSVVTTALPPLPSLSVRPPLSAAALRRHDARSFTLPCTRNFEPSRAADELLRDEQPRLLQRSALLSRSHRLLCRMQRLRQQMRFARVSNRTFTQPCKLLFHRKIQSSLKHPHAFRVTLLPGHLQRRRALEAAAWIGARQK
jgi:hypothetical protein